MLLLLFSGGSCQFHVRSGASTVYSLRVAASSGGDDGGSFPGLPWMPSGGGGDIYTTRTLAGSQYTVRPAGAGLGAVCE